MKRFLVIFCGMCICGSSIGMGHYDFTFVNDSKSVYTIDASELKNAVLSHEYYQSRTGKYKSVIEQVEVHPGRYLYTHFFDENTHLDHGCIKIKCNENIVSVLNIRLPNEHFSKWKLILDNEGWWCRFSVNEPMKTVVEKQIWEYGQHFIRIHDYNPEYRYSNQPECPEYLVRLDYYEFPEPPANGDKRPQAKIPAMCYESVREDYMKEEYKSEEGGCCLLQ